MSPVGSGGRLALFLPTLDDGGAEQVMLRLAGAFAARGHAVDLVLAVSGGPLAGQVPPGPRVVGLNAGRTIAALPALAAYLRRERPDALLATLEHANVLCVAAARLARTGVRLVLREANVVRPAGELPPADRLLRALMRPAYRAADHVVAVSDAVAASLIRELGLPAGRVRTIYNPVITPALPRLAAAPLDDPWFSPDAVPERPVILGVGRLVPQKDFATLLRAFAQVRRARPARLLILGEGAERARLEALAGELGVAADVRLPGFDHNPFRYLTRAPLYVLSSIYEGLPGALIQAMACGCRVISTDCPGGSREILDGGRLGALVPPGDPAALARAIEAALDAGPARLRYPLERFAEGAAVDSYLDALGVTAPVTANDRAATNR